MSDVTAGSSSRPSKAVPSWLNSPLWHSREGESLASPNSVGKLFRDKKAPATSSSSSEQVSSSGRTAEDGETGKPDFGEGQEREERRRRSEKTSENGRSCSSGTASGLGSGLAYGKVNGRESDTWQDRGGGNNPTDVKKWEDKSKDFSAAREPIMAVEESNDSMIGDSFFTNERIPYRQDDRLDLERKTARFYSELAKPKFQMTEIRRLAFTGIPNEGSLRATTWKLLLGYLSLNSDNWEEELRKKRQEYAKFREELIINPTEVARRKETETIRAQRRNFELEKEEEEGRNELRGTDVEDHPLSQRSSSVWHQYFKDTELVEQIDRDVKRTHPDIPFFNSEDGSSAATQDAMRRILFVFAKLNPGIRYVQGMNEVLAPLLYVFSTDPDKDSAAHAEPDAFFCFSLLLSDFRDHFCQQLDNSVVGIRSTITRLVQILRRQDPELWRHLEFVSKVNPQFYSFRWITLLLTQDFEFNDILRIWDSLLADTEGPLEILLRICCAMLVCIRERLLAGDFTMNLKLLQKYPSVDIEVVIQMAKGFKT